MMWRRHFVFFVADFSVSHLGAGSEKHGGQDRGGLEEGGAGGPGDTGAHRLPAHQWRQITPLQLSAHANQVEGTCRILFFCCTGSVGVLKKRGLFPCTSSMKPCCSSYKDQTAPANKIFFFFMFSVSMFPALFPFMFTSLFPFGRKNCEDNQLGYMVPKETIL